MNRVKPIHDFATLNRTPFARLTPGSVGVKFIPEELDRFSFSRTFRGEASIASIEVSSVFRLE